MPASKKAKDVMHANPSLCRLEESVYDAVQKMEEENCGAIPIVDAEGQCVGIVTDRDICLSVILSETAIHPKEIRVAEVMTDSPMTCHPDDEEDTVIRMMEENQIRRVPVVDATGRCVGIISQADIALEDIEQSRKGHLVEQISK
jgi:CBS domain-containing protein